MSTVSKTYVSDIDFEPTLAKRLNVPTLYIKREDQNPSGSHKDRSIWPMMEHYLKRGKTNFVISSSGNAAISAAYFMQHFRHHDENRDPENKKNIILKIFISPHIHPDKKKRLMKIKQKVEGMTVETVESPKAEAFQYADQYKNFYYLRSSTDAFALDDYETLARELVEQVPGIGSIFIPTSSGTCALGLYRELKNKCFEQPLPQIHIVQTTKIHPIAAQSGTKFVKSDSSLATAIVDNVAHRKKEVIKAINESEGCGWVVSDEELIYAEKSYQENSEHKSNPSYDSLLSLAGLMKALKAGWKFEKPVVLLFTGK